MRRVLGLTVLVVLTLASTSVLACDDMFVALLQPEVLGRIARAKGERDIRHLRDALPYVDSSISVTIAVRSSQLGVSQAADELLIASCPRNPIEHEFVYSMTRLAVDSKGDALVASIPYTYLDLLAKAVLRTGKGFREYLMLNRFADGEILDQVQDWSWFLFREGRQPFMKAFRELDPETQRRFCGDRKDECCSTLRAK